MSFPGMGRDFLGIQVPPLCALFMVLAWQGMTIVNLYVLEGMSACIQMGL
jgi:hypothetical protein